MYSLLLSQLPLLTAFSASAFAGEGLLMIASQQSLWYEELYLALVAAQVMCVVLHFPFSCGCKMTTFHLSVGCPVLLSVGKWDAAKALGNILL